MRIDINQTPEEIISSLTPVEISILSKCARMKTSVNKNFNKNTIKKKLKTEELPFFEKSFNNLIKSGIIVKYRKENYGISKKGRIIQNIILNNERKEKYSNLNRILIIINDIH